MNKKYGVGFIISMIFLILVLVCVYQYSYNRAVKRRALEQEAKEEAILKTKGTATKEDGYMITISDGYVIVYYSDGETVYEYTSIKESELPSDICQKMNNGMRMDSLSEVYGILENYSS